MCWAQRVAEGGHGGQGMAFLPPCPLSMSAYLCTPALPSLLLPQPCTLPSRPQAGRPWHAWACSHCQLCSDATAHLQLEVSAVPGTACANPGAHWALPPTARGRGPGWVGPSLPLGLCLPIADALQTHNTVFQEHAAPSSPSTAPTTRGFRRASEISIASQVSGMAESYTASGIAQSECGSAGPQPGGMPCHSWSQLGHCAPRRQLAESGDSRGGHYWHLGIESRAT